MNEETSSRLLFRLQHLIPRLLTSVSLDSNNIQNSSENPREIQLDMTWGKICGNFLCMNILILNEDSI